MARKQRDVFEISSEIVGLVRAMLAPVSSDLRLTEKELWRYFEKKAQPLVKEFEAAAARADAAVEGRR